MPSRKRLQEFLRDTRVIVRDVTEMSLRQNVENIKSWCARFEDLRRTYGLSETGGTATSTSFTT
jgi:hypothetical protein